MALARLQVLCRSGNFAIEDFRRDPMKIFAAHEVRAAPCAQCSWILRK